VISRFLAEREEETPETMLWVLVRSTYLRHRRLEEGAAATEDSLVGAQLPERHWIINAFGSLICVGMFALISGLFLGLLTLDTVDLQIIQRASLDEEERRYATALIPLVKRRHQILVTLELMNALAYETLPIFLDALVPSWAAVLLSVTIVMIFGEIIPSGIFMGPNQLYLGYHMVPLMQFFLWLFHPLATPLVKLLDYLTDTDEDDTDPYSRSELSALVRIQHEAELNPRGPRLSRVMKKDRRKDQSWRALKEELLERVQKKQENNPQLFAEDEEDADDLFAERLSLQLHPREVAMVEGALRMKTVHAMDVYTPLSTCYCVADNLVLDKMTITTIYGHGFSRVPVYRANPEDPNDNSQILGFLITRQLMLIDWDDEREISNLPLQRPTCVSPRMNLIDLFEVLQKDGRMMTFVCARPDLANKALKSEIPIPVEAGLVGIISLVDIMESIVQDRIYDEGDIRDRDRAVATLNRWAATIVTKFLRRSAALKKLERRRSSHLGSGEALLVNHNHHTSTDAPSNGISLAERHVRFHEQEIVEEAAPLLPTMAPPGIRIHKPKLRNRLFKMNGQ
jgi:metal transporter CNNM